MSTLDYAARAGKIRNKPQMNTMLTKKTLLREYVTEIERLKADLKAARLKHGVFLTQESFDELSETSESRRILIEEFERKCEQLEHAIGKKQKEYENAMSLFMSTEKELATTTSDLNLTRESLQITENDLQQTKTTARNELLLRKAHQSTEERLAEVGKGLVSTVNATVKDVNALHAKIGRMAELEMLNHTAFNKSKHLVTEFSSQLSTEATEFLEGQKSLTHGIQSVIGSFIVATESKLAELSAATEKLDGEFTQHSSSISSKTEDSKNSMNAVLEEIKTLRDTVKADIGAGLSGLSDAAERMAGGVVTDLATLGKALKESYERLRKDVEEAMEGNRAHIQAQEGQIQALKNEIEEATRVAVENVAAVETRLEDVIRQEREQAAKEREDLISTIAALIRQKGAEADARLDQRVGEVKTELGGAVEESRTRGEGCRKEMDKLAASEKAHIDQIHEAETRITGLIKQDEQSVTSHFGTIRATAEMVHSDTVSLVAQQTEQIAQQLSALDDFVTRAREQNEAHHATFASLFSQLSNTAEAAFSAPKEFSVESKTSLDTFRTDVNQFPTQLDTAREQFEGKLDMRVGDMKTRVESVEMREYQPTGQTPRKRKYQVDVTLPRTRPHDEILGKRVATGAGRSGIPTMNGSNVTDTSRDESAVVDDEEGREIVDGEHGEEMQEEEDTDVFGGGSAATNLKHQFGRVPLAPLQVNTHSPVKPRISDKASIPYDKAGCADDVACDGTAPTADDDGLGYEYEHGDDGGDAAVAATPKLEGMGAAFYPSANKNVTVNKEEEATGGVRGRKRQKVDGAGGKVEKWQEEREKVVKETGGVLFGHVGVRRSKRRGS